MSQKKATIQVHVQPGARSNELSWLEDGILRVKVTAPPRKGRANQALVALMAEVLGVPKSAVQIIRGTTGRRKLLAIQGLDSGELKKRLSVVEAGK
ncbi:MAG TPA: DUF167 domain-containing protein [Dehalococcoidia bacterium]|nr:DUF167 domain-containing protein [Dehalococcoidia bacterium]